ncbi:ABC transporter permease [Clavibacter zhangzhiyongii]|uniref:ABC transporter permease n=1 Tax=Clavibacter zhangzhiyongii TaxID=2768071 RepID=UPI0039DF5665
MTAPTPPPGGSAARAVAHHPAVRPVTFRRMVAGERIKIGSLRSTWWILLLGTAVVPAFAVSRVISIAGVPEAVGSATMVGAAYVTGGVALAQLAFAVLGVMVVAGEYGSGQIRTTLTVTPTRVRALLAKAVVLVLVVVAASTVAVLAAWAASAPWFGATGMSVDLRREEDARLILGTPLYLGAVAALAFGIGLLVRSAAAGISIVVGLLLVVENLLAAIPWAPLQSLAAHLPSSAGSRLLRSDAVGSVITVADGTELSPWGGYGVMLLWVLGVLAVATALLRRRDA